jgi:AraC-like DNA-binding protein
MNSYRALNYISNFIIGAGIIQGLFQALILLNNKRGNRNANRILGVLLIVFSINIAHSIFFADVLYNGKHIIKVTEPFQLLFGPIVYFYVKVLTNSIGSFKKTYLLHFLPFAIYTLFLCIASLKNVMLNNNSNILTLIVWTSILVHITIYTVIAIKTSGIHNRKLKETYSDIDRMNIDWLKYFIIVLHGIYVVYYLLLIFMIFSVNSDYLFPHFQKVISIVLSIAIYSLGYRGLTQPKAFTYEAQDIKSNDEPSQDTDIKLEVKPMEFIIKDNEDDKVLKNLLNFMEEEKPYLNSSLTLPELSESIGISRNRLSQIINEKFEVNFYDFINRYRVKEVQRLILDPNYQHLTFLALAFDAGFNSKSTFNSIFKKHVGMTPSEYKKLLKDGIGKSITSLD